MDILDELNAIREGEPDALEQRAANEIIRLRRLEMALKTTMATLRQIAETPRNAGAKRNANATVKFLQTQGIDA